MKPPTPVERVFLALGGRTPLAWTALGDLRAERARRARQGKRFGAWLGFVTGLASVGIRLGVQRVGRIGTRERRDGMRSDDVRREFMWAIRASWRRPASSLMTVLATAVGITGVSVVATLMIGALLVPLPYPDSGRLLLLAQERDGNAISLSWPDFRDWEASSVTTADLAGYQYQSVVAPRDGGARRLRAYRVTARFFSTLGVDPALGRTFSDESAGDGDREVVVSHAVWRDLLGADRSVLGTSLVLEGEPFAVIGVMPPEFDFRRNADVWLPLEPTVPGSELESRSVHAGLYAVARPHEGVDLAAFEASLSETAAELEDRFPDSNRGVRPVVTRYDEAERGDLAQMFGLTFGAVLVLLAVACLNALALTHRRNLQRRSETALQVALGCSRRRLVLKSLAEAGVLTGTGGLVALVVLALAGPAVAWLGLDVVPGASRLAIDPVTAGIVLLLVAAVTAVIAVAPPLTVGRRGAPALRSDIGAGQVRMRSDVLVAGQVALSILLLSTAALLGRSLHALSKVEMGFDPSDVLSARVDLPADRFGWPERVAFFEELLPRIAVIPGVESAGVVDPLPLSGRDRSQRFWVEGTPYTGDDDLERVEYAPASPGYFEAMDIDVVEGRGFDALDVGDPSVALVARSTAERLWPEGRAVGQRLVGGGPDSGNPPLEVIGVVEDVRHYGAREAAPLQMYFAYAQLPLGGTIVVEASSGDAGALVTALRAAVAEVDPGVPIYSVAPLDALFADTVASERAAAGVLTAFATAALLLTLLGVTAVLTREIARRQRELAIRASLGATHLALATHLVRTAMVPVGVGTLIGLILVFGAGRAIEALVYGVSTYDLATLLGVAVAVMLTSIFAALIPAIPGVRRLGDPRHLTS
jgi:predicted permease